MYQTEAQLIAGLIARENDAYRSAIKQYQTSMKYLAYSLVGNKIADEVVQEAWLSAMKAIPLFEGRSSLKTWLLRIVANEGKTRLRTENRMTSLEAMTGEDGEFAARFDTHGHWQSGPVQWDLDSPEALLTQEELKSCLDLLLSCLPALQGSTLYLHERQGYSLAEICNILEVSESNVRVLLHRARIQVFKCVEHFQQTGECCAKQP